MSMITLEKLSATVGAEVLGVDPARMVDDETLAPWILDEDGYLAITDRVSDVIIRGGENLSAQEIEEQLLLLPGVAEAAVVAAPDPRLGERAAAVLRLLPGASAPSLDEVRARFAEAGMAKQKWPESLHVVVDLPRTASGKVQKFVLRQHLRDGTLETAFSQE
jgi:acyl-CoA synthetase (AMP-forming)/AMP-acid ligase II